MNSHELNSACWAPVGPQDIEQIRTYIHTFKWLIVCMMYRSWLSDIGSTGLIVQYSVGKGSVAPFLQAKKSSKRKKKYLKFHCASCTVSCE